MKRQFLGRLLSLFLVGTVVAGVGCKDYDDDITSLNNRIDELTTGQIASVEKQMQSLQNAVDRLDGVDSGLKDEIEALQGKAETQAGEIGKLQEELGKAASASEVEALKKQIETLESDKGKLEKRIEALESARTSLQDEIDAVKGSLANYLTKSDAEATYATKTTVESLSQLLNQIKANYVSAEGLASTLEGYVTDAELADYPTLTVLQEAIRQSETAMKNSLGEAMEPILAKYNFVQKDVLDLEIQDLQEQIDALNGKPDADGSLANIKSRLEALENAEIKYDESNAAFTKGVEDCIGKALANDGAIDQAIANAIKDVAGEYEGTMQDLKNLIDGLRMDVDQLLSRIQSLVYVPAYDDHKASVNALYYAPEGEEPVLLANGTVEMTFRVTPVEAAGQLVAAYAAEPEMFSLEMEQVKTRATVPALNIQKVEADETGNGRFIVTALPADFTPDFFTGKVSYSIALRVQKAYDAEAGNDYSANVVSDYVNLVPARADVKAVVLAPAKEDGSIDADRIVAADGEVAYEIPYDDTDMVVELMKGYKLWATDGEAYYDLAQLADMGYSLEAPVVACTSKAFKADGTELESADKGNFEVANGGEEVCDETVKLIAADKSTRNNYLLTEHAYTVAAAYDALNPTFNSRVTIVKTKRGVTLDLLKYVWNYSDFRTVYEAGGEYEGAEREFTLKVTESTLPQDITPENIVTYWNQGGSAVVKAVELDAEGKPRFGIHLRQALCRRSVERVRECTGDDRLRGRVRRTAREDRGYASHRYARIRCHRGAVRGREELRCRRALRAGEGSLHGCRRTGYVAYPSLRWRLAQQCERILYGCLRRPDAGEELLVPRRFESCDDHPHRRGQRRQDDLPHAGQSCRCGDRRRRIRLRDEARSQLRPADLCQGRGQGRDSRLCRAARRRMGLQRGRQVAVGCKGSLVAEFRIECAHGLLGSRHRSGIRLHDRQEGCAGRMGTGIGR